MTKSWSDHLIEQTCEALNDGWIGAPDGFIHLKNFNGEFGKISFEDLMAKKWLIQVKNSDNENIFATIDELIAAGWTID